MALICEPWEIVMTCVEVSYNYGVAPDEAVLRGMDSIREVYGIRRLRVDETAHRLTVEYDATRLNLETVANLLRRTGLDLKQ
jgi:hypothetical protein